MPSVFADAVTGTTGLTPARTTGRGESARRYDEGEVLVTHAQQMLEAHPRGAAIEAGVLLECIDACFDCAQSCTTDADADLAEDDVVSMIRCIRLCLDCADQCTTTGQILSRQTEFEPRLARAVVQACAQLCNACAEECARHADHHEHCRVCADV